MSSERECESGFSGEQSRCSLCRERLRSQHTHFGQWKSELQQFLLKYTEIPASCVCKACERSIRRGFDGKFVGEYIPRWIKHGIKKQKQCCCVPGCDKTSERSCVFASFDVIREASSVSVSEEEVANVSSPFFLCRQHYYDTFSYCRSSNECALCGSKSNHHVIIEKYLAFATT